MVIIWYLSCKVLNSQTPPRLDDCFVCSRARDIVSTEMLKLKRFLTLPFQGLTLKLTIAKY